MAEDTKKPATTTKKPAAKAKSTSSKPASESKKASGDDYARVEAEKKALDEIITKHSSAAEKKKAKSSNNEMEKGCIYYRNFIDKDKIENVKQWVKKELPTAEEFIEFCEKRQICPYEINRLLMRWRLYEVTFETCLKHRC